MAERKKRRDKERDVVTKKAYVLGPFGPGYGSEEGRKKKKNLPNLAPGAPFIGGQCGPKRAHILVATTN